MQVQETASTDQVVAKLYSSNQQLQEDAIEEISILLQKSEDPQFVDSMVLKVADVFANSTNQLRASIVTNQLRAQIVAQIFQQCQSKIESLLTNKEVFLKRIESNLVSNDPQARILSLKILSYLPSFLITRLSVQHLILHILTTSQDKQERNIAIQTIQHISNGSDLFAKSIMKQIELRVVSGYFGPATCAQLIRAMMNVPGDSVTSMTFFETITRIYDQIATTFDSSNQTDELSQTLVQVLLRRTLFAPILFETTFTFLESIQSFEGIQILSRKYPFSEDLVERLVRLQPDCDSDFNFIMMTLANQYLIFGTDWLPHLKDIRRIGIQQLKRQLTIDGQNEFALNLLLYVFFKHDGVKWVSDLSPDLKLDGIYLEHLSIALIETKRLSSRYPSALKMLEKLMEPSDRSDLRHLFEVRTVASAKLQYYKLKTSDILPKLSHFAASDVPKRLESLHNFVSIGTSVGLHQHIMDFMLTSSLTRHEVFELATRHFCGELPLMTKALIHVLEIQETSQIGILFSNKDRLWRYIAVCLILCEVLSPMPHSDAESEVSMLMERYMLAQDALHKAIQCLSEWQFPGKHLLEQYDPIQNDATQESHKVMLLYQIADLAQSSLYAQMLTHAPHVTKPDLTSMVNDIEAIHEIKLATEADGSFTLPYQMFKLRPPAMVEIRPALQEQLLKVKKDKSIVLNLVLRATKACSKEHESHIVFQYQILQYHGTVFRLEEGSLVESHEKRIKLVSKNVNEVVILSFPTLGTYLLRLACQLVKCSRQGGAQHRYGLETRKYITIKVE